MSDIKLVVIYLVLMAVAVGLGLWLDRHARQRRRLMKRMAGEMDALAAAFAAALIPSFQEAARAVKEFTAAWDNLEESS